MWMRGGTSKGGYFLAEDLPADRADRDAFHVTGRIEAYEGGEKVFEKAWDEQVPRDLV